MRSCKDKEVEVLDFEQAINFLIVTIHKIREQGKSTRYGIADNYMRSSQDINYSGATFIETPDKSGTFKSFSKFIEAVEKANKVKTKTIEGFKEIFLIDENPEEESEFLQTTSDKISQDHWKMIMELIIFTINKGKNKPKVIYKKHLMNALKEAIKKEKLPYFNPILRKALDKLIEIEFITIMKQPSGKIEISKDYEEKFEDYLEKIMNRI